MAVGFEYQIRTPKYAEGALDSLLRGLAGFSRVGPAPGGYQYRHDAGAVGMPDAEARIEPGGLYFCVYGNGDPFLAAVVMACLAHFHEVTVVKLDWE